MSLILIAHNIRSCHNVGSLLRSSEGLGVDMVYLTGYTPYPKKPQDSRLPHLAEKIERQIAKTALGAEKSQNWQQQDDVFSLIYRLNEQGFTVAALEQTPSAIPLHTYEPPYKLALLVGREVEGVEEEVLDSINIHLQIPMHGSKESFNVSVAAAMALYFLKLKIDRQV